MTNTSIGLGLAISKMIIDKLGGHLWIESEIGKGTTINFTINFQSNSPERILSQNYSQEKDLKFEESLPDPGEEGSP